MKRHCMVVYALYPLGETRVQREAEALLMHGYEVDVICLRLPGEPAVDQYKGVRIFREKYRVPFLKTSGSGLGERFFKYLRFFLTAALRVTRLHLGRRYCTIQVHNLPDFLVFCTIIPKLMGAAIILDLHDLMPEFFAGRFRQVDSIAARLIRWQERISCEFADHVITVSEHWRQILIRRGVSPGKCSVVMNVADDRIFSPPNGNHKTRTRKGFRLIYHGSMKQRYGIDLAVQAVEKLRNDIPGIHLSLVGNGDFLPYLHAMIEEHKLQDNVSIEHLRLAEELPEIICSCDLGIVPYRNDVFTDGLLPTKLMEYAALGLPAIAARTTAIETYFMDTNTEFFEPGDLDDLVGCIIRLYNNPDRMAALSRGSKHFTQRYNWLEIRKAYVSSVDRLREGKLLIVD